MRGFFQSLRHTIRLLAKSPGFTVTAVLILGLGIGTNTAMFSLIDTAVLRPLPMPRADRLVQIGGLMRGRWYQPSYPDYLDIEESQRSLECISASAWDYLDLGRGERPERITTIYASPSLFRVTASPMVLGRWFREDEDKSGGPLVAVLSEPLWRERFDSDRGVIGKKIVLSDQTFEVIGVSPRQVEGLETPYESPLYLPIHVAERFGSDLKKRDGSEFHCFGRLKDGVSIAQARADLSTIQDTLTKQYPDIETGRVMQVESVYDNASGAYADTAWLLEAAMACLLLISCANISCLLLARGIERGSEIAIRSTLGASRVRLIGQLLVEALFLSFIGGIVGLIVFAACQALIKTHSPAPLFHFREPKLDAMAFLISLAGVAVASLLSGLLPAITLSRTDLAGALKGYSGRTGTAGPQRQRAQILLVSGQIALACMLLVGVGLLARSFQSALGRPLGFNPHQLVNAAIQPTSAKYQTDIPRLRRFFDSVLEKARQLPGVTDAAFNDDQPFEWTSGGLNIPFSIVGEREPEKGKEPTVDAQNVSPGYFRTMQIPLVTGRDIDERDREDTERVVVIDRALAEHFFPGKDALGRKIHLHEAGGVDYDWMIVGVAQNSIHNRPDNPAAPFQAYFSYHQRDIFRQFLILRMSSDPAAIIPMVQKVVSSVDSGVPATWVDTFDNFLVGRFEERQFGVMLMALFSGAALLLSAVGLYGVLACFVNQRKREIGIRIAVGAQLSNILQWVLQQGLKIIAIGLAVGLCVTLICRRFIEGFLYGVSASDPLSLLGGAGVLLLVALIACLLPAFRAISVNPIEVLRE